MHTPDDLNGQDEGVRDVLMGIIYRGRTCLLGATAILAAFRRAVQRASEWYWKPPRGPYEQLATNKFYEGQNYVINNTNHVYEWVWFLSVKRTYQKLRRIFQDILSEYAVSSFEGIIVQNAFGGQWHEVS